MIVIAEEIQDLPLFDNSATRSPGLHVSAIIRCIAIERGILTLDDLEDLSLVDVRDMSNIGILAQLRIHMGMAWDLYYLTLLPEITSHPGELEVDGVFMTPDGETISIIKVDRRPTYVMRVVEVKCTYKSTKTVGDLRSQFMWLAQVKSYCNGYKTRYADLHVLFVCGNYKFPIRPMLIIYHIEFTQEEIDDNWSLLTDYAKMRLAEQIIRRSN